MNVIGDILPAATVRWRRQSETKSMNSVGTSGGIFIAALVALAGPAAAGVACTPDGFQRVQGELVSTPFCQDNLVGRVAREYGLKVTDAEIRNNPNRKADVCRFVGQDIRAKHACQGLDAQERGGKF